MKTKIVLLILAAAVIPASASVTLSTQFGVAFDSAGVAVPDGTLWALVVDGGDNLFAGFTTNSSLSAVHTTSPGVADTFFAANQSLALGSAAGGGTVFAMGAFNGTFNGLTGLAIEDITLNYGINGTAAALAYAFYWFPGATYTGGATESIGSQVGGINTTSGDGVFDAGMILPNDGALITTGAANEDGGGTIANSSFTAVNLVPEPSSALLGALGALCLLRRRRN